MRLARLDPGRHLTNVRHAIAAGHPVPLYIGDRWLPRHVVLVVDADEARLRIYEPAQGVLAVVTDEQVVGRRVALAGWDMPWFVVLPAQQ